MRLAVVDGRATLVTADGLVDVAEAGGFPSDVAALYPVWDEVREWAEAYASVGAEAVLPDAERLGPVSPRPAQVFAIGLNYVDHAAESGFAVPEHPIVFTKFASSITGPSGELMLPGDAVDWEIELVAVVGAGGRDIPAAEAWDRLAGVTIGQDYSERDVQFLGAPAQFSLGKSFPGFAPIGPVLVTPDELPDPASIVLECAVGDEVVQSAALSDLVFPIPRLVELLSAVVTLLPGDLIFTGTPPGVGFGRSPRRYLRDGEVVTSRITGIGEMRQVCVRR